MKKLSEEIIDDIASDINADDRPYKQATANETRGNRSMFKAVLLGKKPLPNTVERFLDVLEAYGYEIKKGGKKVLKHSIEQLPDDMFLLIVSYASQKFKVTFETELEAGGYLQALKVSLKKHKEAGANNPFAVACREMDKEWGWED